VELNLGGNWLEGKWGERTVERMCGKLVESSRKAGGGLVEDIWRKV